MLVLAIVLWGGAIAPTKWALESIPPSTLMFLRLFVSGALLFLYAWYQMDRAARREFRVPWWRMFLLSFTGVGGYFLCTSYGIAHTSGLHASIIDAVLPLVSLLFAALFLKERIGRRHWVGMVIGFLGVLLLAFPAGSQEDTSSILGDALIVASTILFAVYMVLVKKPRAEAGMSPEMLTALLLLVGSVMALPTTVMETLQYGVPTIEGAKVWWSLSYLIFGASIVAYIFWNKGLESVSATMSGLYLNFLPLVSIVVSVLFLREALTVRIVLGACLVFAGVFGARDRGSR